MGNILADRAAARERREQQEEAEEEAREQQEEAEQEAEQQRQELQQRQIEQARNAEAANLLDSANALVANSQNESNLGSNNPSPDGSVDDVLNEIQPSTNASADTVAQLFPDENRTSTNAEQDPAVTDLLASINSGGASNAETALNADLHTLANDSARNLVISALNDGLTESTSPEIAASVQKTVNIWSDASKAREIWLQLNSDDSRDFAHGASEAASEVADRAIADDFPKALIKDNLETAGNIHGGVLSALPQLDRAFSGDSSDTDAEIKRIEQEQEDLPGLFIPASLKNLQKKFQTVQSGWNQLKSFFEPSSDQQ